MMFITFVSLWSSKLVTTMSSAKAKVLATLLSLTISSLIYREKSMGLNTPPCWTPIFVLIVSPLMSAVEFLKSYPIAWMTPFLIGRLFRISMSFARFTLSKAYLRSTKRIYYFFLSLIGIFFFLCSDSFSFMLYISSINSLRLVLHELPSLKPLWFGWIRSFSFMSCFSWFITQCS